MKEMEKLSKELDKVLPLGAGSIVDEAGKDLVKKYGKEVLDKYAKVNYKNTEKILNN